MKKSYDFGYEDGYRDCKEYYEKILTSLTKEINDYKNTIEILDLKLRLAYDKNSEEKDLIAIGRAVKALVKEIEMIVSAAVKIFDYRQNKEWCIPCHRHSDAFFILT